MSLKKPDQLLGITQRRLLARFDDLDPADDARVRERLGNQSEKEGHLHRRQRYGSRVQPALNAALALGGTA